MKYAAVFGPSSKECKKLGKLFYQAVNLMGDRVILEKEWSRLKERESTSSMSSGDPSSSTACSENSPGLLDEELDPGELVKDKLDRNGCQTHFLHESVDRTPIIIRFPVAYSIHS